MRVDLILFLALFLIIAPTSQAAAIHDAAKKGDVAALTAALDSGAEINASDGIATPLYYAIDRAHLEAAKMLIARGADANVAAKWGPPLLAAAESGKTELVKLLLDAGADAAAAFKGQTALHAVARNGCLDCVVALVEKGADVNALTSLRQPPIHFAKEKGHESIADYLLSHGYVFPAPPPVSPRLAMANSVKGETLFKENCQMCHAADSAAGNLRGPSLWNIVGQKRGTVPDYKYSPVLRAIGGVWSYENLNIFISDPSRAIPGTDMSLHSEANMAKEMLTDAERADIIAFLRSRSDNPLPLP
jgi:cytochrome c